MSQNINLMEDRQPHALVDFNPTSQMALTPVRGLSIWTLVCRGGATADPDGAQVPGL